ncbi:MAG: DUF1292 domain-containing protein [Ruminococcus sp.]|nr:DUF1292 domain-containing protein [Ruminococcus sp.]
MHKHFHLKFYRKRCIIKISNGIRRNGENLMNEFTPELFELIDQYENKRYFELISSAELNGEQYYAMLPTVEDENFLDVELEPVILKVIEENGEEVLASIDDEDEFEEVSRYFDEYLQDIYDYDDYADYDE